MDAGCGEFNFKVPDRGDLLSESLRLFKYHSPFYCAARETVIRGRPSGIFQFLLFLSVAQRTKLFLSVFFSALGAVQVSL